MWWISSTKLLPVAVSAAVLLLAASAIAQDESLMDAAMPAASAVSRPHPLTNLPSAAPGIETTFIFPEHNTKVPQLPAGDIIEVLVGFHNGASSPYNITAVMGSLNSPLDFGIYVQNFTHMTYGLQVDRDGQASISYRFRPDPALHPREFTVALSVFYTNSLGQMFSNTFFNSTIEIVEPPRSIDAEILFLWVLLLGSAGFALFKAYTFLSKVLLKGGKTKRKVGPPVDRTADEWLEGTALAAERKRAEKAAAKKAASAAKAE